MQFFDYEGHSKEKKNIEPLKIVQETQQFLHDLMHRYLKTNLGDINAGPMMDSFVKSVKDLREMADILDFQRLRL